MFCWKYCSSEYFCASFCLNTCCGVSWHLGVGFLGYAVTLCLTFWGTATLFARMACTTLHSHRQSGNFTFPPAIWEGSSFSTVKVKVKSLSRVRLFATPWTVAYQAPPSMGFSRQEYWSGLPFPSPGDLPDLGIESGPPALQADALPSEPPGKSNKYQSG